MLADKYVFFSHNHIWYTSEQKKKITNKSLGPAGYTWNIFFCIAHASVIKR